MPEGVCVNVENKGKLIIGGEASVEVGAANGDAIKVAPPIAGDNGPGRDTPHPASNTATRINKAIVIFLLVFFPLPRDVFRGRLNSFGKDAC